MPEVMQIVDGKLVPLISKKEEFVKSYVLARARDLIHAADTIAYQNAIIDDAFFAYDRIQSKMEEDDA